MDFDTRVRKAHFSHFPIYHSVPDDQVYGKIPIIRNTDYLYEVCYREGESDDMFRKYVILGLMILAPLSLLAQRSDPDIGIQFGGSFPGGDFGAGGSASSETRGGFAEPGVTGGAEVTFSLTKKNRLGWISSLLVHLHKTDYTTFFQTEGYQGSSGSWLLVTPFTGLRYKMPFASDFAAYAYFQSGLMYGQSPEITLYSDQGTGVQNSANGSAFAYNIGLGIVVGELVNLGFRYIHGEPTYHVTQSFGEAADQKRTFVQKITMAQLIFGFNF